MSKPLDFTKRRMKEKAETGGKIIRCPSCNKKGALTICGDRSGFVAHKGEDVGFAIRITEVCHLDKGAVDLVSPKKGREAK